MFPPLQAIKNNINESRLKIMSLINFELNEKPKFKLLLLKERDNIVLKIEDSIFKKSIQNEIEEWSDNKFLQLYSRESYRIIDWIKKIELPEIIINYENIAFKSTREIYPELYLQEEEYIKKRSQQKIIIKTSKQYKCAKCGGTETKTQDVQMRSFDEGSSLSITCVNCNAHWIIS